MKALLSSTYFGPVQWYQKLNRAEVTQIERWESFQKQTFRNRCVIATTNGLQALTFPIERGGADLIQDIRISDHGNWRHLHWNALTTAYSESPFFEYYQDDIRPFFEQRWEYLIDYNEAIREKICELLDIRPKVAFTQQYLSKDEVAAAHEYTDYREGIRPKHPLEDADFTPRPYYQVFGMKHGFQPNLSILDLLMNCGNESIFFL